MKILSLSFFFILGLFPLFSQDLSRVLSEEDAVLLALSNNGEVLRTSSERLQALRTKRSAWSTLFPQITVGGALSWNGDAEELANPLFNPDPLEWSLRGNLNIGWNFTPAIIPGLRLAQLGYDSAESTAVDTERRVERDVRKMYLDILLLQRSLTVVQERSRLADARSVNIERSFANGLADEYSMLQIQLQVESINLELLTLETQLQQLLRQFALLLGVDADMSFELSDTLVGELPNLSLAENAMEALWQRSDVENLVLQKEIVRQRKLSEGYQLMPTLGLSYGITPSFGEDPLDGEWFSPESWDGTKGVFTISLTQRLDPFFPLSSQITNIQNYTSADEVLDTALQNTLSAAAVRVYQLQQNIERGKQSLETLNLSLSIAQRAYTLAEDAYRAGLLTFDSFEQAELDYRSAEDSLLREQVNILKDYIDLAYELQLPMKREQ